MPDEGTTQATKRIVLILEDDKFLRDIITSHLKKAGYEVVTATTGEEALSIVGEHKPDMIILDIVLAGISGLDTISRLRQDPQTKDIPFIVFTNSDEQSSQMRGKELGAVKYMVKAVSMPEKVVSEVNAYFS